MRLIDADQLLQKLQKDPLFPLVEQYGITRVIEAAPTVDTELTEEQVKEYCRKRCLVVVSSELFNEMKARWTVKHGRWIKDLGEIYYASKSDGILYRRTYHCSQCGQEIAGTETDEKPSNYCPTCGAKMDEDWEEPEINPCRGCTDYDGQGGCMRRGKVKR